MRAVEPAHELAGELEIVAPGRALQPALERGRIGPRQQRVADPQLEALTSLDQQRHRRARQQRPRVVVERSIEPAPVERRLELPEVGRDAAGERSLPRRRRESSLRRVGARPLPP